MEMVRIGKIWLFDLDFKNPTGFLGEFPKCIQMTYSKHDCLTLILFDFFGVSNFRDAKNQLGGDDATYCH